MGDGLDGMIVIMPIESWVAAWVLRPMWTIGTLAVSCLFLGLFQARLRHII